MSEKRAEIIVARVRPHLTDDEHVLDWVRARRPHHRTEGFVFSTERRVIVHWAGRDGDSSMPWDDIRAWGVDERAPGGPVLIFETDEGTTRVQLRVDTRAMAAKVHSFLGDFRRLVGKPRRLLADTGDWGDVHEGDVSVNLERRSVAAHTKRVVVTVGGVFLVTLGLVLSAPGVPGPGILTVLIGLGVLATEYDWAKDLRDWIRDRYKDVAEKFKQRKGRS